MVPDILCQLFCENESLLNEEDDDSGGCRRKAPLSMSFRMK
jgi:hypothetical protein